MGKAKKVPTPVFALYPPYLVQRCKAQEFNPSQRTGEYLKLDYMGSAEFEFGAIPRFQREVNETLQHLVITQFDYKGRTLFFASWPSQVDQYKLFLQELVDKTTRTKERVGLDDKETLYVGKKQTPVYDAAYAPYSTDVWLDLTNGLFFARTEEQVKNLFVTIPNSVRYMDQQEKAAK